MLDKLIESRNNGAANKRINGFLLTTFFTAIVVLTAGLIFSLFNQTLAMGNENLDVSTLVAPLTVNDQEPPPPIKHTTPPGEISKINLPSRVVNMQKTTETPIKMPDSISVSPNQNQARPDFDFKVGKIDSNQIKTGGSGISGNDNADNLIGLSTTAKPKVVSEHTVIEKPPLLKQSPKPDLSKNEVIKTGGVVNSKAINLMKPIYTSAARAIGAKGQVKVQVTIDEEGRVISASAIDGHPLLRESAVAAARSSRFTPTTLSNQKVKVTGIIIYNFIGQ